MRLSETLSQVHHPAGEDLRRFMAGELPPAEVRKVVRHLLTGCPACVRQTRGLWSLGEPAQPAPVRRTLPAQEAGVWQ
jgi:hypothetical protein